MFRWLTDVNWLIDRWRNGALHTTGTQSINRYHQQSEHTQDTSRKHRWVTSDLWWPRVTYNLQLGHYKCVGFARVHNVWKGSATMHYKYCIRFIFVMYVVGARLYKYPPGPIWSICTCAYAQPLSAHATCVNFNIPSNCMIFMPCSFIENVWRDWCKLMRVDNKWLDWLSLMHVCLNSLVMFYLAMFDEYPKLRWWIRKMIKLYSMQ